MTDDLRLCSVCNFPIIVEDNLTYCSEFCIVTSHEVQQHWRNLKEGEYGSYPCSWCGCHIEDEFYPGNLVCGRCGPKVKLKKRTDLLLKVFEIDSLDKLEELKTEITKELDSF